MFRTCLASGGAGECRNPGSMQKRQTHLLPRCLGKETPHSIPGSRVRAVRPVRVRRERMNGAVGMGTAAEGKEMGRILLRYYYGRRVDDQDRIVLDRLCRAAFIDFYRKDGVLYARASKVGRCLEPTFRSRMRLLLGRI